MPVSVLTESLARIRTYDVSFLEGHESGLVVHAMLYTGKQLENVGPDTALDHFHMGPPLEDMQLSVYATGTANLSPGQVRQIKAFVDGVRKEKNADDERRRILGRPEASDFNQYWLLPDIVPPSASFSMWKFSCIGFVRQSYRQAGIELFVEDLPLRDIPELTRFYSDERSVRVLASRRLRERLLGLHGDGPWPISLVGYAIHSLARPESQLNGANAIPYEPTPADSHYPHSPLRSLSP